MNTHRSDHALSGSLPTLAQLAWRPFFQQQLSLEDLQQLTPGRVVEQHRTQLKVMTETGVKSLSQTPDRDGQFYPLCVGDWVLFDDTNMVQRVLERQSLFSRKAPGSKVATQLIAANVDSVFIVCSLNQDFNLNRIERYLALAKEAQVEPIVVLTKADQCDDVEDKCQQVQALDSMMLVYALNALDGNQLAALKQHCRQGQTVTLLGSSGVGKSTVVNGLLNRDEQDTGAIREDDSKGRHTTTSRSLVHLPAGGWLMDTPGMRELQLADCEDGVGQAFAEITALAQECRFFDCSHHNEPGCALLKALKQGSLEQRRFDSYQKLMREQAANGATLAEKRAKDKAFSKMVNNVSSQSRAQKKGY